MEVVHEKNEILKKQNIIISASITRYMIRSYLLTGQNADALACHCGTGRASFWIWCRKDQSSLATYYVRRMQIHYMAGNYRTALSMSQKIRPIIGAIMGFMVYAEYYFYDSLIITSVYNELSSRKKALWQNPQEESAHAEKMGTVLQGQL